MKKPGKRPSGNQLHQLRMYDCMDQLIIKSNFASEKTAKQKLLQYFTDEHDGPLYSRGIVRRIDPVLKHWITPLALNNSRAVLFDPGMFAVEEWRFSIYDIGDNKVETHSSATAFKDETIKIALQNRNAFYGVISAREPGASKKMFVISRIIINKLFNLHVSAKI